MAAEARCRPVAAGRIRAGAEVVRRDHGGEDCSYDGGHTSVLFSTYIQMHALMYIYTYAYAYLCAHTGVRAYVQSNNTIYEKNEIRYLLVRIFKPHSNRPLPKVLQNNCSSVSSSQSGPSGLTSLAVAHLQGPFLLLALGLLLALLAFAAEIASNRFGQRAKGYPEGGGRGFDEALFVTRLGDTEA